MGGNDLYISTEPVNVFSKYPFFRFLLPLIMGILAAVYADVKISVWIFFGFLALFILMFLLLGRSFWTSAVGFVLIMILGVVSVNMHTPAKTRLPSSYGAYSGTITEQPRQYDKYVSSVVRVNYYRDSAGGHAADCKVLLRIKNDSTAQKLSYGDEIMFYAKADSLTSRENPFLFDYARFLSRKGIYYSAFVDTGQFKILDSGHGNKLLTFSYGLRRKLMDLYERNGFEGEKLNVLSALTLGYKRDLDKETADKFAISGAMHILAVSGLHVGIIFLIVMTLVAPLRKFKQGRYLSFAIVLVVLWGFALLAGFSPSVKRSAFMFSLVSLGKTIERKTNIYNTLAASAFFMLLFDPYDIASVGFWLSYAAVFSIVFLYPKIYSLLIFKNFLLDKLWSLISVSIAAQFGTLPLSLYVFHRFPVYFILTNIVAIPLAGVILYSAVFMLAFFWLKPLYLLFGKILSLSLDILLYSIDFIRKLPHSSVENVYFSFVQMILLYLILFAFAFIFIYKRKRFVFAFLLSIIGFLAVGVYQRIRLTYPYKMIFYSVPKHTLILATSFDKYTVLADSELIANSQKLNSYVMPYLVRAKAEAEVKNVDDIYDSTFVASTLNASRGFVFWKNKVMFILSGNELMQYKAQKIAPVDYLLLRNNVYLKNIKTLFDLFDADTIIADGSNSSYKIQQWKKQCHTANVSFVDVSQKCFILR